MVVCSKNAVSGMKLQRNVLSDAKLHRESDLSGTDDPRNYFGPEVRFEDIVSDLLERRLNAIGTYLK
jgi:hypothetical protein